MSLESFFESEKRANDETVEASNTANKIHVRENIKNPPYIKGSLQPVIHIPQACFM